MRFILTLLAACVLLGLFLFACGGGYQGQGPGPCVAGQGEQQGNCVPGSPQPTATGGVPDGTNGVIGTAPWIDSCTYYGGVCVSGVKIWINDKVGNNEGGAGGASTHQVNTWVDLAEDANAFASNAKAGVDCAPNYDADKYTSNGECKFGKYINFVTLHSNQLDNPTAGQTPGPFPYCSGAVQSLTKIGASAMGDYVTLGSKGSGSKFNENWLRHQSGFTDSGHRLFFTVDNCANPGPSTYTTQMDRSDYQDWADSYVTGTTVNTQNAGTDSGFDKVAAYEEDVAGPSQSGLLACNGSTPCGVVTNPSVSNEYATDTLMVASYTSMYNRLAHANGMAMRIFFNGCGSQLSTANTLELENHLFDSSNVIGCEFEKPIYGFGSQHNGMQAQGWTGVLDATSMILADYANAFVNYNNSESPDSLFNASTYNHHGQGRILTTVQWMLAWKSLRFIIKQGESNGTSHQGMVFQVYPEEQFSFKAGDGFPVMAKFAPTSCLNCDANGFDSQAKVSSSGNGDGNDGSGCDLHDAAADHGAADLLVTGSTGGATPAGSCLQTGGSAANCTTVGNGGGDSSCREDWKGNRVGVYCREFDNAYYPDPALKNSGGAQGDSQVADPITSASTFSLGANYLAVCFNPSNQPYTLSAAGLPRHGAAGYGHQMAFSTFAEGQQEILAGTSGPCPTVCTLSNNWANGGSMNFTTTFTLGAAGNLPAETGVVLVN